MKLRLAVEVALEGNRNARVPSTWMNQEFSPDRLSTGNAGLQIWVTVKSLPSTFAEREKQGYQFLVGTSRKVLQGSGPHLVMGLWS